MRIGFQIPFSGNFKTLQERLVENRGNAFQIYARGLRGGKLQKVDERHLKSFQAFLEQRNILPPVVHAPYAYNLALGGAEDEEAVLEDLEFARRLGAAFYVIHPGRHKKGDPEDAKEAVKEKLARILEKTEWQGSILIKNMSGEGSEMCAAFEDWAEIVHSHERLGAALDLARAYSAGRAFAGERASVFAKEVEMTVSWRKVGLVYVNDSERFCGSAKNLFAPFGRGSIGFSGYDEVLSIPEIKEKTWILECHEHKGAKKPLPGEKAPSHDLREVDRSLKYLTPFFGKEAKSDG